MNITKINECISYIKASNNPLSSDIAIIRDNDKIWLYDVGNNVENCEYLKDNYNIVISHFHLDHIGSLDNLKVNNIFVSKETFRHCQKGVIINQIFNIGKIKIMPIPSSHCKGSLILIYDDEYAFMGDSIYGKDKEGCEVYNCQLLKQQIDFLETMNADKLLISHNDEYVVLKKDVIEYLKGIYGHKDKYNNEIIIKH